MAFVYGDIGDGKGVLARLHRADVIGDVFGGAKPIHAALARFKAAGRGVIVYLRDGTAGVPVAEIPHEGDTGADAARSRQWREVGPRRADPQRPRHFVDPPAGLQQAHLCGPRRLRHRDRRYRNPGVIDGLFFAPAAVPAFLAFAGSVA